MKESGMPGSRHEALLAELEGIRDVYRLDVRQFVSFVRERKLLIVEGFRQYARWLDEEHAGKRYSPATINRKLAAARSRVRYAFKHSSFADDLQRRYRLEEILKSVKLKKIDPLVVSPSSVLGISEVRRLVWHARSPAIRLMTMFLVRTGVHISEMLHLRMADVTPGSGGLTELLIRGKGGRQRTIKVKSDFLKQIQECFGGRKLLFEHDGRGYSRISVANRIRLESMRILGKEVSPRQLRHTWAAMQIKKGRSVTQVAAALGHASAGRTAQMYSATGTASTDGALDLEEVERGGPAEASDPGGSPETGPGSGASA